MAIYISLLCTHSGLCTVAIVSMFKQKNIYVENSNSTFSYQHDQPVSQIVASSGIKAFPTLLQSSDLIGDASTPVGLSQVYPFPNSGRPAYCFHCLQFFSYSAAVNVYNLKYFVVIQNNKNNYVHACDGAQWMSGLGTPYPATMSKWFAMVCS